MSESKSQEKWASSVQKRSELSLSADGIRKKVSYGADSTFQILDCWMDSTAVEIDRTPHKGVKAIFGNSECKLAAEQGRAERFKRKHGDVQAEERSRLFETTAGAATRRAEVQINQRGPARSCCQLNYFRACWRSCRPK
jgi:hypothetical protein